MFPSHTDSADHIPNEEIFNEEMFPSHTDSADHIPNKETCSEEMFPSNTYRADHIPRKETCSTNQILDILMMSQVKHYYPKLKLRSKNELDFHT